MNFLLFQVLHIFDGVRRGNYFREEPIKRTEVEVSVRKLKNGNAAGKDEETGDIWR